MTVYKRSNLDRAHAQFTRSDASLHTLRLFPDCSLLLCASVDNTCALIDLESCQVKDEFANSERDALGGLDVVLMENGERHLLMAGRQGMMRSFVF